MDDANEPTAPGERVLSCWASLAGVDRLRSFQVVVAASSPLCPPGWVGVVSLAGTVTVCAPDGDPLSVRLG